MKSQELETVSVLYFQESKLRGEGKPRTGESKV